SSDLAGARMVGEIGQCRVRRAGQRVAWLRLALASALKSWRAQARRTDRNKDVLAQRGVLKTILVEPARQGRMVMGKQKVDLRIEQEFFASGEVGGDQLDRSVRPGAFRLADPIGEERLRQRV